MNKYECFPIGSLSFNEYSVVPLREEDVYSIMNWRNAQIDILRQKKFLTSEDQKKYYTEIISPSFKKVFPNQLLFSYLYKGSCIGYGGLVHISWEDRRAELSFVVDDKRASDKNIYKQDFETFLNLMKYAAFEIIKFNRIFTETYSIREFHINIIESSGFLFEGQLREHVIINNKKCHSLIHGIIHSDYEMNRTSNTSIIIM